MLDSQNNQASQQETQGLGQTQSQPSQSTPASSEPKPKLVINIPTSAGSLNQKSENFDINSNTSEIS